MLNLQASPSQGFNNNMQNDRTKTGNKVPYFDIECKQLKKNYCVRLIFYRNNACNETRIAMKL